MKSPPLQEVMRPLARLEKESQEELEAAKKEFAADIEVSKARKDAARASMLSAAREKKKSDKQFDMAAARDEFASIEEPPVPKWRRYQTNTATVEKLGEILANNPRGVLVFRDELIGLLSTWDKDGHEADRAFALESWNGTGRFYYDTISRGTTYIPNACQSILGGIQPDKLISYLYGAMRGTDNDGMVERFGMAVYPDRPKVQSIASRDRYPNTEAKNRAYNIVKTLAFMNFADYGAAVPEVGGRPYFQYDDDAQNLFYEWFDDLDRRVDAEDQPIIAQHLIKYRKLMPALALIFHLIDIANGTASGPIPRLTAKRAMAWCGFLEARARRIYGLVTNIKSEATAELPKHIRKGDLEKKFTLRDVYRRQWSLLADKGVVESVCERLVDLGWLRELGPTATGGRTKSPEYVVNPRLTFVSFVSASDTILGEKNELAG